MRVQRRGSFKVVTHRRAGQVCTHCYGVDPVSSRSEEQEHTTEVDDEMFVAWDRVLRNSRVHSSVDGEDVVLGDLAHLIRRQHIPLAILQI